MMYYNIYSYKLISGIVAGCIGALTNDLLPLFICVIVFEIVDFVTGCWKSAIVAKSKGGHFAFESIKAWRTIYKVIFIFVGIVLSEMLDATICEERIRLANIFTSFVCGVEFWSFLENAAVISDHPIFRWLRKFMKEKVEDKLGTDFNKLEKDGNDK